MATKRPFPNDFPIYLGIAGKLRTMCITYDTFI